MSAEPRIAPAEASHAAAIAAIYRAAALCSHATFDLIGHPEEWWLDAIAAADPRTGHLILVALDSSGELLGYAKSGTHKDRAAYDSTCETSAYVAAGARGRGVGRTLYAALLERLDESPLRLAVAGVAEPNDASTRLHLRSGFTRVGVFSGIGAKRGRAWDVTWYERPLAAPRLVEELRALVAGRAGREAVAEAIRSGGPYALVRLVGPAATRTDPGAAARAPADRRAAQPLQRVPVLDPANGEELGAIEIGGPPLRPGDRLLLEWCAEALAPLFAVESSRP